MNHGYTAYMSKEEKQKQVSDMNFKETAKKIVYGFFGVCTLWFCYSMYEFVSLLIFN